MNGVEPCGCFVGTMVNTVGGLAWKLFSLGTMMLQCQTLNGLSGGIIIVGHNTKTNIITRALPSVGAYIEAHQLDSEPEQGQLLWLRALRFRATVTGVVTSQCEPGNGSSNFRQGWTSVRPFN